ncbi:Na+/H+ antiporter subunit E [Brevundimonas subvibrioides]|uniref:Cation antiporter n=1 Tax=Brevundimonas subvibrioides (strain ATCC 15264 / DSM 4735 / LMG 14903 / NBRC 16000 / CB 81) TaxID=633149 RepID=D9QIP0_BRESC|nr:Na+/H+ antiporter subunit E [Brevundimonas subvibrioides]ADL01373.1 cation antiporter [Brevundimonas subvibrioides ATCC 15264]
MIRRLFPHPALSAMLVAVWMLLVNAFTFGALFLALVFGVLVPLYINRFWPDQPRIRFGRALIGYVGIVLFDIVIANFHVASVILTRRNRDLRARWLVIPLELRSPEAITTLAATISLTPGTVSSDISGCGRFLLVHALDVSDPEAEVIRMKRRYEGRLLKVFI